MNAYALRSGLVRCVIVLCFAVIEPVTAILSSTLGHDLLLRASAAPTELVLNDP